MNDPRHRRLHVFLLALKVALSLGLLVWALARVHPGELAGHLEGVRVSWLLVAAALFALSNVLGALLWGRLLQLAGIRLTLRQTLSFYWVGLFFSNLLPANVGGDVFRVHDAGKVSGRRRAAAGAVVLDRIIGFAAIALLAVAAMPFLPAGAAGPVLWGVVLCFSLAVLALCLAIFDRRILGLVERPLRNVTFLGLGRRLSAVADEIHAFHRHRGALLGLMLLALVVQLLRVEVHVITARALGLGLSPLYFFVIVPILAVVVALPVSVAGLGVRESAAVGLFGRVGLSATDAVTQQLLTFFVCLVVNLAGGVLFVARSLRRPAWQGVEGTP